MRNLCFCIILIMASITNAVIIDQGVWNVNLPANTSNNIIDLEVTSDTLIRDMIFRSYTGDGGPEIEGLIDAPEFTSLDFTDSIWEDALGGYTCFSMGKDPGDYPQVIEYIISLNQQGGSILNPGQVVNANGTLITLVIDTTGFNSGSYDLFLNGNLMGESFYTETQANQLDLYNGIIFIYEPVIPEPSICSLFIISSLSFVKKIRKNTDGNRL